MQEPLSAKPKMFGKIALETSVLKGEEELVGRKVTQEGVYAISEYLK